MSGSKVNAGERERQRHYWKGMKISGKEVRRELEGRMKLFKVLVMSIIGYRLEI